MKQLPYLTSDLPGTGGLIKQFLEDFIVDEIPLYRPFGEGTHLYFRIEKRDVTTHEAVRRIARHLNCRPRDIGFAGLKDARGVTTQTLSVEHVDPALLEGFGDRQIRILDISKHTNKLKTGHLAGNRFRIRIRDVGADRLARAQAILDVLTKRGVPNYFGPQRFGARGDTALLGQALVDGNDMEFVEIFLGRPQDGDPPDCRAAREAFDANDLDTARNKWPRHFADQRKALAAFRKKHDAARAVRTLDRKMIRLYVSAFQSDVFNDILSRRIDSIDRILPEDIARKTDTGGIFPVEDPGLEQPRADRFEVSPTGLLPGYRTSVAGTIEQEVLDERGIDPDNLKKVGSLRITGTRRSLRFPLEEPAIAPGKDEHGQYLELSFAAPSGSYATVVVREITKQYNRL